MRARTVERLILYSLLLIVAMALIAANQQGWTYAAQVSVSCHSGQVERVNERVVFNGDDCTLKYAGGSDEPPVSRPGSLVLPTLLPTTEQPGYPGPEPTWQPYP